MRLKKGIFLASVPVGLVALSAPALAQASDPGASGEIVVTAQKRVQKINDVGMTITALSGDTVKDRNVRSVQDLSAIVPGLTYSQSAANTPVYSLRGIGFYETTLAAYPDVSVYVDEIPLPLPVVTRNAGFDLERVEILKGPQGTVFGNNATGGAINYIAAKPTDTLKGDVTLGYSRFDTKSLDFAISGPLSNTLSARLSGMVQHSGDWQHGYTNNKTTGKTRAYAGRFQLVWAPVADLKVQLILSAWNDDSDPLAEQYIQYRPNYPVPSPVAKYPYAPADPRAADFGPTTPFGHQEFRQASGRIDWDVTPDLVVTSLTSYIHYKRHTGFDGDGTTLNDFDLTDSHGHVTSFFQELRVAKNKGTWRGMIGGNYSRDKAGDNLTLDYRDSTVGLGSGLTYSGYFDDQIMKNAAVFGSAEYDIGPVTLKGGVRYTEARRSFQGCGYDIPGGGLGQLFTIIQGANRAAAGLPAAPPIAPGGCITISDTGAKPTYLAQLVTGSFKEHNTSFRAGVDWKVTPDALLYFNATKGYKAGSFPSIAACCARQYAPVVQESLMSYEAGFKLTLFDRAVQANAAAFYYDYKNKQTRSKLLDAVFGVLDNLVNVPKSRVYGLDVDVTARPTRNLMVYANFVYLDGKITQFVGYGGDGVTGNYAGAALPYTPKYQGSAGFNLDYPLSGSATAFVGGDVNYKSRSTSIIGNNPLYEIASYATVDARLGVRASDGKWKATVWGKNLFNKYYWNSVTSYYDTVARYASRPVEYGVTVGYSF